MVLESRDAIFALAPLLEKLAARCGQPGAMHWLKYFLDDAVLGRRSPRLVLFLEPEGDEGRGLRTEDLRAAALFFEYELFGLRTGVVATGDAVGFNSVIAPEGQRAGVAAAASRMLMERGAVIVLSTFESCQGCAAETVVSNRGDVRWATRERAVQRILQLGRTLDETLATLGKSTRFNLRYYRRRLEKQMPCTFVTDAAPLLRAADLEELNAHSLNPVAPEEFVRRIAAASDLSGSFLCGLQGPEAQWLSLVGGWRQGTTTVLYWQMNASGLEKHSIGTVMRSYLLESEIARGAERLLIFGGTPHSMRHAFVEDTVADLIVERVGLRARVVRCVTRVMLQTGLLGRGNFVAEALCEDRFEWQFAGKTSNTARQMALKPMTAERPA